LEATANLQRRYSLLFRLPSTRASATISVLSVVVLSLLPAFLTTLSAITYLLPSSLLLLLLSFLLERALLANYPVATLRRLMAISYVANGCWITLALLGLALSPLLPTVPSTLFILGFFLAVAFRLLIFVSAVCGGDLKGVVAAIFQPLALFTLIYFMAQNLTLSNPTTFILGSLFVASVGIYLVVVDRASGDRSLNSLKMLRAFLEAWAAEKPDLLERLIEERSEEAQIKTYLLAFSTNYTNPAIVVSDVHPGPFANVGSSNIPFEMQRRLSDKFAPLILHSFSSHDLNLPSKKYVDLLLESLNHLKSINSSGVCTEFLTETYGKAIVNGIAFDGTALLTITLAPEGMEDFPSEVSEKIRADAAKLGFNNLIIVDAHNSQGETNSASELNDIVEASKRLLQKLRDSPKYPFKVGFSHSSELNLTFKQDVGAGGIGVLLFEVAGKRFLLVGADANNAVRGLRDRLVNGVKIDGVKVVELCTSDTHSASGKARSPIGYSPLGELTGVDEIINAVRALAKKAEERLADATLTTKLAYAQVKVMGEKILNEFSRIFDNVFEVAKTGGKILLIEFLLIIVAASLA
jgi:putative membrane protein